MATQTIPAYELNGSRRYNQQVADRNLHLFAAQQRARRGPTPEVFCSKRLDNTRLVKAADPVRVREMRIFTAAMTVLFVIVMFYGLQHFSAIEYGYKVEAEKQQRTARRAEPRVAPCGSAAVRSPPHRSNGPQTGSGRPEARPGGPRRKPVRQQCPRDGTSITNAAR